MLHRAVAPEHLHARGHSTHKGLVASIEDLRRQLDEISWQVSAQNSVGVSAEYVNAVLAARRRRRHFFDPQLFADPAWDILLEVYANEMAQTRISVSKLCYAAGVPATTALRWVNKLEKDGLLRRKDDPFDSRRSWIELTDAGSGAMRAYFESCSFPI